MAETPLIWDIGENIIIEVFIIDPNTSFGLTGQSGFMTLTIQRSSDGKYWAGGLWQTSPSNLILVESSSVNQPGRYNYNFSGNSQADHYVAHVNINNPPTIQGDSYEVHISRNLDVRVYESEAD